MNNDIPPGFVPLGEFLAEITRDLPWHFRWVRLPLARLRLRWRRFKVRRYKL